MTADREDPGLRSILSALLLEANDLVSEDFVAKIRAAADGTAASVRAQVAKALGITTAPATLAAQIDQLTQGIRRKVEERAIATIDRARDVFREWDGPEAEVDELDTKLDEGLDGITGGAVAGAALIFGGVWADMNEEAQLSAGVREAIWIAQRDPFTRPAHAALDDRSFRWGDPPLKASESSNGQDCYPGTDYNCRCIASPLIN